MLKKIAILTAAAGMLSTSMAVLAEGPTVYGRVSFGFQSVNGETDAVDSQRIDDNTGSRFGFKGSNDLGNGTSVDYLLEYGAGEKLSLRHSNMSLNGSFGQFRLGKQTGVLYRYIGANIDQSHYVGGPIYYHAAKNNMNSEHGLRMSNIAAYRFGAGPGGDDPITFDIQVQSVDMSKDEVPGSAGLDGVAPDSSATPPTTGIKTIAAVARKDAKDDDETIDSVTIGAATALGPVKLQLAYVDENGSDATDKKSPSLLAVGFRVPLGSAEVRGYMMEVDADADMRDDNEAWGLMVMNDFGSGYFGVAGVGNYSDGGKGKDGVGVKPTAYSTVAIHSAYTAPVHKNAGDKTSAYVSLNKSLGGGLSVIAEYVTVTKTITKAIPDGTDFSSDDETESTFQLSLVQSF